MIAVDEIYQNKVHVYIEGADISLGCLSWEYYLSYSEDCRDWLLSC